MFSIIIHYIFDCLNVFSAPSMPSSKPSLYAAIKLARLVQHFKERLKARVKSHRLSCLPEAVCQNLQEQALNELTASKDLVNSQHLSHHVKSQDDENLGLGEHNRRQSLQLVRQSEYHFDIGITR